MSLKFIIIIKFQFTINALEIDSFRVFPHMLVKCGLQSKALLTDLALEWFYSRMNPFMHCQLSSNVETFTTNLTVELLINYMYSFMSSKIARVIETFLARVTLIFPFACMNFHVTVNTLLLRWC